MVARKAHNLETWFESNGRNYFICCRGELLHYKIFKLGHFKLSSIVTMKFAGMGQWSTPLDL